jgi:hypothetical protein
LGQSIATEYEKTQTRYRIDRLRADVSPSLIAAADRETGKMNQGWESGHAAARAVRLCGTAFLTTFLLAACAETGDFTKAVGWFSRAVPGLPQKAVVALPDDPGALATEGVEGSLRNSMELAKAKRFAEARAIMADLAGQMPPDSDFWRSIKCSEMVLALRGNELPALMEAAEAVERNLKDPLRPPGECVSQLSIARALRGQPLPLNVPESLASALQAVPKPREVRAAQAVGSSKVDGAIVVRQVAK